MLTIIFLILIIFFGLTITLILNLKIDLPERFSTAFLSGIGIFTIFIFIFDWAFNINFSLHNTFSLLISVCIPLFAYKYREIIFLFKSTKLAKKPFDLKTIVFWSIIFSIFAYSLIANLYWPITDWDALAMYDFRAKLFLIDGNMVHAALNNGYFLGYPFLTSLAHLFIYQTGFNNPKFFYSLIYLSFITIFYFSLRRNISENKAMIFTLIMALIPEIFSHSMMAYTNLSYVVYLCAGTFYLFDWTKNKNSSFLLLSAILVGLSAWVRSYESFWLAPAIIVFIFSIKYKKLGSFFLYITILLMFSLPWKLFVSYISNVPTPIAGATGVVYYNAFKSFSIFQIYTVTKFLVKKVFLPMGVIPFAFLLSVIYSLLNQYWKKNLFSYITLLFIALLFGGAFVFSMTFSEWELIAESAVRLSMFLVPFMIYSVALTLGFQYEKSK